MLGQKKQEITEAAENFVFFESTLSEVVNKAAAKVSARYETSIDIKTEVENKYRALRRVKNPNPCQPVTFHYYQLMKKIRRQLFLVEQTYHCTPGGNVPAGVGPGRTLYHKVPRRPQNLRPKVVAPPPEWTITEAAASPAVACARSVPDPENTVEVTFPRPLVKQLTRKQVVAEVRSLAGEEAAQQMDQHIGQIEDLVEPGGGGLILTEEFCVGTDGFHVEGVVSDCAICEDTELKKKELECKKLELELEKRKCEIELCKMQLECDRDDRKGEDYPPVDPT